MATMSHRIRGAGRSRQETLERLLGQQGAALRSRKQILRDGLPTATSGVLDFEEHSLDAEEQGVGFSVLELTLWTLQAIETALQRLEAGDLGTCPACSCRISNARLRALPFAALCLACQERDDSAALWRERVTSHRGRSLEH
jgi:DnaK suppressor protein